MTEKDQEPVVLHEDEANVYRELRSICAMCQDYDGGGSIATPRSVLVFERVAEILLSDSERPLRTWPAPIAFE